MKTFENDFSYPCVDEPKYLENQFTLNNSMWFAGNYRTVDIYLPVDLKVFKNEPFFHFSRSIASARVRTRAKVIIINKLYLIFI